MRAFEAVREAEERARMITEESEKKEKDIITNATRRGEALLLETEQRLKEAVPSN